MHFLFLVASTAEVRFYQSLVMGLFIAIGILFIAIWIMRVKIRRLKKELLELHPEPKAPPRKEGSISPQKPTPEPPVARAATRELPDPGLLYRFSLADEGVTEKTLSIGQTIGNIKTFSTEVLNDHLNIYITIIKNRREKDIYNLPEKIFEEYLLDIRRGGKCLIYYPGKKSFEEMSSRLKVFLKQKNDEAGELTFPVLEPTQPIRFRIGDRLNQDGKFVNGFFEFHLFNKNYEIRTKAGIPKVEKLFYLRLYKIYPGYDTGSPNEDGFFPMIDPFTK